MEYTKREKILIELFQKRIKELEERITLLEFIQEHNNRIGAKRIKGIKKTIGTYGHTVFEIDTDSPLNELFK